MNYPVSFNLSFTTNSYSGKYYAFEGIDGSGKTTQAEKLVSYFESQGKNVLFTKEPTDGIIGKLILDVLHGKEKVTPTALQHLFTADRAEHLENTIIPALKEGTYVISDRTFWSSVAYGASDLEVAQNEKDRLLAAFNILAMYGGFLIPDKTFLIAVPCELGMQRVEERKREKTLYEKKEELLKRVASEYAFLAEKFPDCITTIDGTKDIETIYNSILAKL
ncbi:MAG: dTMP kinase [Candidatus Levyibacteriota bacterium]